MVFFGGGFRYGEAEAGAVGGFVDLVEAVEDFGEVVGGDCGAVIYDYDSVFGCGDFDFGFGVFCGVVEEDFEGAS